MRLNKWTVGLAAAGLVSVPASSHAEERMNQVWTSLSSTTISGYVDTSVHWDLGSGNAFAPGYAFNGGKQDGFNLNVVKLSIERPLDESQWAAGYKVDLLFGPDANAFATQSAPLSVGGADLGVKQAYVALRAPIGNGLDFKVGVWDTIIGYEVFEGPNNPNYTRSWGYTIEPTTHTGVLMSYQINDMISTSFGIANTLGPVINGRHTQGNESYKTYLGSVAFTAPDDWGALAGSTLYAGIVNGNGGLTIENQTSYYLGMTMATPIEGLRVGASYDYVGVHDNSRIGSAYANAVAVYLSMQASEKLKLHGRGEYASYSDKLGLTAFPSKVFSLTGTLEYDLWKNVLSRLEVRWDHSANGDEAFGGDPTDAVPTPDRKNHYLVAANLVYKF